LTDDLDQFITQAKQEVIGKTPDDERDTVHLTNGHPRMTEGHLLGRSVGKLEPFDQPSPNNTYTEEPLLPDRVQDRQFSPEFFGVYSHAFL
jgi:hypothetical protein